MNIDFILNTYVVIEVVKFFCYRNNIYLVEIFEKSK